MKSLFTFYFFLFTSKALFAQTPVFEKYEQQIPGSGVSFIMLPVLAGSFTIGSPESDGSAEADERPQVKVELSAYWLGAYEVSFAEFNLYFNDTAFSQNIKADAITRPSSPYIDLSLGMGKEGRYPANSIQPYSAMMYCKWLYKKTGIFYRLPTEAEWEYACRAGSNTIYPFGNDTTGLSEYAWYNANSDNRYHKAGLKKPNAWGFYDMLGNLSEWVLDQYEEELYSNWEAGKKNPVLMPVKRHPRLLRGGSYRDPAGELRSANRQKASLTWNQRDPQIPKSRWWYADAPFVGFRILRPLQQPSAAEAEAFYNDYLSK